MFLNIFKCGMWGSSSLKYPFILKGIASLNCNFTMYCWCHSQISPRISWSCTEEAGIILCMGSANERRYYNVRSSSIGRAHTLDDPWEVYWMTYLDNSMHCDSLYTKLATWWTFTTTNYINCGDQAKFWNYWSLSRSVIVLEVTHTI